MSRIRTKSGDGYPLDVVGNFFYVGAIVCLAEEASEPPLLAGSTPPLKFGYIKKLGKSYVDVACVNVDDLPETVTRCRQPSKQLMVIEADVLNSLNPAFEKLKLAAAQARTYG